MVQNIEEKEFLSHSEFAESHLLDGVVLYNIIPEKTQINLCSLQIGKQRQTKVKDTSELQLGLIGVSYRNMGQELLIRTIMTQRQLDHQSPP